MATMSQAQFQVIADVLRRTRKVTEGFEEWNPTETMDFLEDCFVYALQQTNPRFNETIFRKAARS